MTVQGQLEYPRMRPVETHWIQHDGQPVLLARDRTGLTDKTALIPAPLAILLSLCDGGRDRTSIRRAFAEQTGMILTRSELDQLLQQLEEAFVIDGPAVWRAHDAAVQAYRAAACRQPTLAGGVYPPHRRELDRTLRAYGSRVSPATLDRPAGEVRGIVSPHIDYHRGGPLYAQLWQPLVDAVRQADLVVVFGTDHAGSGGSITLTRQHYATPYGILPTDLPVVDAVAEVIGEDQAFAEELHHKFEHSIELALVWLHSLLHDRMPSVVPILCGSFHPFTQGERDAATDLTFTAALQALADTTRNRRVVAVAAADLAHVGPAFGDPKALSPAAKSSLRQADAVLMAAVCRGDANGFLSQLVAERDQRKVCGLPPIYLMLRFLGETSGTMTGYDQCPADDNAGSIVSIAGAALW